MTIIRISHQKNYSVINNLTLEDTNLSFKAKGLWTYCMSRPDDWIFHVSHLATVSRDGEDAVRSALKELEAEGYLTRSQKNENGVFGPAEYVISENKNKNNTIKKSLPLTEKPHTGNTTLLSTDPILNTERRVIVEAAEPPHAPKGGSAPKPPTTTTFFNHKKKGGEASQEKETVEEAIKKNIPEGERRDDALADYAQNKEMVDSIFPNRVGWFLTREKKGGCKGAAKRVAEEKKVKTVDMPQWAERNLGSIAQCQGAKMKIFSDGIHITLRSGEKMFIAYDDPDPRQKAYDFMGWKG